MISSVGSVVEFGSEGEPRSRRLHAVAPVLIGMMAPVVVLLAIDPRALGSASVLLHIYLLAIFVIAAGAYTVTVFDQGEVTKVAFDKDARAITVERTGLLAKKTTAIDFSDVASIRVETRYDDDGYKAMVPLIVLSNREVLTLPPGTSEDDVATMRALLSRT